MEDLNVKDPGWTFGEGSVSFFLLLLFCFKDGTELEAIR